MTNKNVLRVPIGRFSKMTRLSVKALRLYDSQGLLRPAHVDPASGYRYYHLNQAHHAEVIRVLRSIDMPLEDIKQIVESESDDELRERLQRHKNRLVERLAHQQSSIAYLETMIENREVVTPYEIELSQRAPTSVAAVKLHTSLATITGDIPKGFGMLMQGLGRAGTAPAGAPMILYHNVIDQESEGDIEVAVPVDPSSNGDGDLYVRELEAGAVATTTHQGSYEGIVLAYHSLTRWISEHGYDIAGPTSEIYVNDPQQVAPEELLTRLEFPVCIEETLP